MIAQDKPLLQRIAAGEVELDGSEPTQLWLIPILLRSRARYYNDAVDRCQRRLALLRQTYAELSVSADEFERSAYVQEIWRRASSWWGLNDIIGYIDIRAHPVERVVQASLFLTTKRATRNLADKVFALVRDESVPIHAGDSNETLRRRLLVAVDGLVDHHRVKRRWVDVAGWQRSLEHTDLIGLLRSEMELAVAAMKSSGHHADIPMAAS